MTEIESVSKKERTDYDSGRDLLSGLPVSIIHIILSFVPIRDAIRTSFLSRNWRYTWTSLPYLAFDRGCANHDESVSNREECLNNFITRALSLHKGSIHKFEISLPIRKCRSNIYITRALSLHKGSIHIDEWLVFLSRNDIRELILDLGYVYSWRDLQQMHSSVYSCNKLTYLELHKCEVGPPPSTFKGFLFLRSLILVGVYLSANDVESVVANSPLLERLKLEHWFTLKPNTELKISGPNLKYIYLQVQAVDYIEIHLCAPLLAEMSVSVRDHYFRIAEYEQKTSSFCNYTNLIGGCTNLEKLRGDLHFTKIMSFGIESCQDSFVFHCLKVIELNDVNFQDAKEMSVFARLMIGAPNLHELKFSSNYFIKEAAAEAARLEAEEEEEEEEEAPLIIMPASHYMYLEEEEEEEEEDTSDLEAPLVSYMDFQCAPDFKWEKLRLITMSGFTGHHSEMEFLKLLLERSPVLERMKLFPVDRQLASKKVRSLRAELLGCNPASPNFKLWFHPDSLH